MPASPSSAAGVVSKRARNRTDRRHSSIAAGDSGEHPKPRAQRATWACERCRTKKLRCTGGHPCSSCRRAELECDFGGRELEHNAVAANQRLAQLEKTVTELVAGLSHLTNPRQLSTSSEPPICSSPPVLPPPEHFASITPTTVAESRFRNHGRAQAVQPSQERTPAVFCSRSVEVPNSSAAAHPNITPLASTRGDSQTSIHAYSSPKNPDGGDEALHSRWAALQQNPAPFPPLMNNPAVWSGEPTKPGMREDSGTQPALGMTHYEAKVDLYSEPISYGLLNETMAGALFTLFYEKCHPSFPLLNPFEDFQNHFNHMRSSSPFLFTAILSIAGRYYNSYRQSQPITSNLPSITVDTLEALADLAFAHLGFVSLRKQHQLSDVQATLLLSVWIARGKGQSPDQWMVTGIGTRLAYRIGIPECFRRPAVSRLLHSVHLHSADMKELSTIVPQWHTWLMMNHFDTLLSLGFGRPHAMPLAHAPPRQYLEVAQKLGPSARLDLKAAAYATSLAELSLIATDLISGLRAARIPSNEMTTLSATSVRSKMTTLLVQLNPRLDEWQRHWTWTGSYDTIQLGNYASIVKIYGEHTRLCLNSLSLNLITANAHGGQQNEVATIGLAKACEAAVTLVQYYIEPTAAEPLVRYGPDYIVLILGQAAMFFVRVLVARLEQPLPVDQLVMSHYLKEAIKLLETNDFSTTGVCAWVGHLSRDLARYTGITLDNEGNEANTTMLEPGLQELDWDFNICAMLGQNIPAGETGLDLSHYFEFFQSTQSPSTNPECPEGTTSETFLPDAQH